MPLQPIPLPICSDSEPDLAAELAAVAERLNRSTVQVRTVGGSGSGVIWQADGLIVTNAHVAQAAHATVELSDGRTFEAAVSARDSERDLAALQVSAQGLPAAQLGDDQCLRVGELVLAVGNPLGLVGALAAGIVHSIGPVARGGRQLWIQADLRLAPGNSGGPLADAQGRVIGINSRIVNGLAVAIPSRTVTRFLQSSEPRPVLGVTLRSVLVPLSGELGLGLLVLAVAPGSAAAAAGLLTGDVLLSADAQRFSGPDDLAHCLGEASQGDWLHLELLRAGKHQACRVRLGGDPPDAAAA